MTIVAAGRATLWSAIDVGVRQIVQFALAIVLARLLTPADFGVSAILIVFSSLAQAITLTGLTSPLIQRTTTPDQQSTLFWIGLGAALLFTVCVLAAAPWLGRFYGVPALPVLMIATSLQIVATAVIAVPYALLIRDLAFRTIATTSLAATAASTAVALVLGFAGAGVWALVGPLALHSVVWTALVFRASAWRPRPLVRLDQARPLLGFGSWVGISAMLEVLYTQGFALVLGRAYGLRDLGLYGRANNLQTIPGSTLAMVIGRVTLPMFANRQGDSDGLVRALLRTNGLTMLLILPISAGLAVTADLVIGVLFGPQWLDAAPVLRVLALAGTLAPMALTNAQLLLACGHSALYFRVELAKKLIGIACLITGSFFGLMGLAWAQLLATAFGLVAGTWPLRRLLGCGPLQQLSALGSLPLVTLALTVAVLAIRGLVTLPPVGELILCVVAGGAVFVGLALLLRSAALNDALGIGRTMWHARRQPLH
jgi:O-antigen/teichoic acid export membrane protein